MVKDKWKQEFAESISTIDQLAEYITLKEEEKKTFDEINTLHPMLVTKYYMSLINPSDPDDPLRRMIIPCAGELDINGDYDASKEQDNTKLTGLQHKYLQTALILTTSNCASYCRYCFRKRFVGMDTKEIIKNMEDAIKYVEEHKEINNVLLSGGDPFTLDTEIIDMLLSRFSKIKHLDFIRIGTKVPVVFPDRILKDEDLLKVLKKYSLNDRRIYIVTQFNHLNEVTDQSTEAINKLLEAGILINNQTALLKKVNDTPESLSSLLNRLTGIGVNPYYVFQCRPVKRVKHYFQVSLEQGLNAVEEAKKLMNGFSKRFKYAMSHETGKIEILGRMDDSFLFKYHQAKDPSKCGCVFTKKIEPGQGWLYNI